jgi:hypothetical protein
VSGHVGYQQFDRVGADIYYRAANWVHGPGRLRQVNLTPKHEKLKRET